MSLGSTDQSVKMNAFFVSLALMLSAAFPSGKALGPASAKPPQPKRVGQVFIVGNEFTRNSVVLHQVVLFPGQVLDYADLSRSEKNLESLGIFKPGSVRVTAEHDPNNPDGEYKNVFVQVEETPTWSLTATPGLGWTGGPANPRRVAGTEF